MHTGTQRLSSVIPDEDNRTICFFPNACNPQHLATPIGPLPDKTKTGIIILLCPYICTLQSFLCSITCRGG